MVLRVLLLVTTVSLAAAAPFQTDRVTAAAQERPLPDADALYAAVRRNLARAQQSTHLYRYRERRTDVHTNPFGRLGTGGTRLFEVYPSADSQLTYRRLIARDGTPVAAGELAEQDRQYRARAEAVRREAASRDDSERRRLETESERARERGRRMIEDVVDTFEFALEGRRAFKGAPAIVVTFTPKPGARPATREGRIAQRFAGTVWVDEQALEVVHVEAKSIDSISFGYGIVARLGEGTVATLTRHPVEGGLWMPTRLTLTGRGRAALFLRRLDVDFVLEWFDYRRLPDGLAAPFLDARVHGESERRPQ